jgi:hypothetical protein
MDAADADETGVVTFGGELWTDASGSAAVELAAYLRDRPLSYGYEIRPLNRAAADTKLTAELLNGRLLITSATPHLKLAWQVTAKPRTHGADKRREST